MVLSLNYCFNISKERVVMKGFGHDVAVLCHVQKILIDRK